ncbi:MAG: DNA mismatch repair endonuclease MutL [Limisphaerales bacterium]|jgi:DNA mismatch repair protein MutL|nr:DNA mismatch repair endonuclease MutL [Verrucomicrobiota bacterium]
MNRIKLLSEQVSNQIAAGEVIERPASVVKELVENSIDAGASRITVEVIDGGRTLIRVSDDGQGMSQDDALMCLERHATSKIEQAEDLSQIRSMGFRGEAIPSIASVSHMTLISRLRGLDSPEGTEINVSGGKIVNVKAAGAAVGTSIEVRNLFYNLPARRKFLRAQQTERSHIQHYITLVASAYPRLALTYIQEKKVVFQFPPVPPSVDEADIKLLRDRMRLLYGRGENLVEVDSSLQYDSTPEEDVALGAPSKLVDLKLWGIIGAPGVSRSARDRQHFFVNRRPVDNIGLNYALTNAYQSALMKGRHPVCCLFLELHPSEVDVNIHPAKREVKFHKEQAVRRIVGDILRSSLERYHRSQELAVAESQLLDEPQKVLAPKAPPSTNEVSHEEPPPVETPPLPLAKEKAPIVPAPKKTAGMPHYLETGSTHAERTTTTTDALGKTVPALTPDLEAPLENAPLLEVPLYLIGVLSRLYLLFESDRGLVIVDQHAAHERILFERLMEQAQKGNAEQQKLLLSETIETGMKDAALLKERLLIFQKLGIGLHEFGARTFLIDALPPFVKAVSAKEFVLNLLDSLRTAGREISQADLAMETIATHACRLAVKANDVMANEEIEHLMDQLRQCKMPYTCPHGRPTIIEISTRELEKKFRRIV